jgi:competence protein ComEC
MVYCTEKGKSYHKKNCTLKHGSKGMKLSEAKKKGYKPCKVCKPPK